MSIGALNWAFSQSVMGPAKAVLIVLADHVDQDGWCWPTVARLGFRSGFAERAVRMALRQLERDGLIHTEVGAGRGRVSRYKVLHNLDAQPEMPPRRPNGAEKVQEMPLSVATKGAPDAPISNTVKGAPNELKGACETVKGAPDAPKPLRTTNKRTTRGTRAWRAPDPPENVYDRIQRELGVRSLLLPPLPEHNPHARRTGLLQ
jgi:hypothetical protein